MRESGGVEVNWMRPAKLDNQDLWRLSTIDSRYQGYCLRYGIEYKPIETEAYYAERGWAAGSLCVLIDRMKRGDLAAAEIGLELMEEDRGLAFGPKVKSNLARALGRCPLTEPQKDRVRKRVVEMMERNFLPKEFRQYAWLARRLGLGRWEARLAKVVHCENPWANWYFVYLTEPSPPRAPWPNPY